MTDAQIFPWPKKHSRKSVNRFRIESLSCFLSCINQSTINKQTNTQEYSPKMPKNIEADVESGMVTPQKPKKVDMGGAVGEVSPAKTAPLSPQTITIDVNQRSAPRGILGMTRLKSVMVVGTVLGLAGGLAYFLLQWFEIPGLEAQIDRLRGEVRRTSNASCMVLELSFRPNLTSAALLLFIKGWSPSNRKQ